MIYPANRADARFVGNEISLKRKREARGLPFCRYHDGLDCTSQPNGCLPSLPYDKLAHTLSFIQAFFKVVKDSCKRRSQVSLRAVLKENAKQTRCRSFVFNAFPIIGIF